jgi:hypothetical protein
VVVVVVVVEQQYIFEFTGNTGTICGLPLNVKFPSIEFILEEHISLTYVSATVYILESGSPLQFVYVTSTLFVSLKII